MTEEADPLGGIDILLRAWPWLSAEAFWSMLTGELSTRRKPSSCHQCSSLYVGDDSPCSCSCSYWPLLISQLRCGSSFGPVAFIISCRISPTSSHRNVHWWTQWGIHRPRRWHLILHRRQVIAVNHFSPPRTDYLASRRFAHPLSRFNTSRRPPVRCKLCQLVGTRGSR